MWQSLISMRFGYVSEACAKEHHTKWYFGEERAQEMWEQQKAAGSHYDAIAKGLRGSRVGGRIAVRHHRSIS